MLLGHAPFEKLGVATPLLVGVAGTAVVGGVETVALGGGVDLLTLDSAVVAVGEDD